VCAIVWLIAVHSWSCWCSSDAVVWVTFVYFSFCLALLFLSYSCNGIIVHSEHTLIHSYSCFKFVIWCYSLCTRILVITLWTLALALISLYFCFLSLNFYNTSAVHCYEGAVCYRQCVCLTIWPFVCSMSICQNNASLDQEFCWWIVPGLRFS